MSERTLFAYFNTPDQAKEAVDRMKSLRLIDYAIERIDGFAGTGFQSLDRIGGTITGDFPGLGHLTLGGDFDGPDAGVLAAANVSASGMSSGGYENRETGRDIMLVAIFEEEDYDEAERIAQECGAL
ncbi:hypothetical protein [Cohnella thailandensis]|uniref:Uncharacterized protein n=1 Tax=Cohnella thailandensis TaxID=557557 RepID=A0A841SSS4_9BACL|nr:hypothetical protein [Cohnella thailandensis]MBB6633105.1 hypothetical protein [Cohnella thailandensis]MBP1975200.1 hypothetical protein [Cohnella thailandensis]